MRHVLIRRLRLGFVSARFWAGYVLLVALSLLTLAVGVENHSERQALFEAGRNADSEAAHDQGRIRVYLATFTSFHRPPSPLSALAPGLGERYGSAARLKGRFAPPEVTNRSASNFLLPAMGSIDFVLVASMVLTLMAVLLSADALAKEREFGTMQLILSHSLPRWRLIAGEYLGIAATLAPALATSLLLAAGAILLSPSAELGAEVLARLGMIALTLSLGTSAFILLGLLASASTRRPATALTTGFFIWIALTALYPNGAGWLVRDLRPLDRVVSVRSENILTRTVGVPREDADDSDYKRRVEAFSSRNREQAAWIEQLWTLTPFSSMLVNCRAAAGTDLEGLRRFQEQVSTLDRQLHNWQEEKLRRYPHREKGYAPSFGPLDISGLPEAVYRPEPLVGMLERLAPRLGLLLLWSLAGFLALQLKFSRYDVRST